MAKKLTKHAKEQSSYTIDVALTDDNGATLTPNNDITWSLTDERDNIMNSREDVPYGSASSTVTVTLQGDDLVTQRQDTTEEKRFFVVKCTYDSDLGNDIPFKDQVEFPLDALMDVS